MEVVHDGVGEVAGGEDDEGDEPGRVEGGAPGQSLSGHPG